MRSTYDLDADIEQQRQHLIDAETVLNDTRLALSAAVEELRSAAEVVARARAELRRLETLRATENHDAVA